MEKHDQQSVMQRVRDTLQSGLERIDQINQNVTGYGALLLMSGTALLAPAVAAGESDAVVRGVAGQELNRPAPRFKPGYYEGSTSQTCSPAAAAVSLCVEGEKIPVSFTATPNKIIDFHTAVTTTCYSGSTKIGKGTFPLDIKQTKLDKRHSFSFAQLEEPGTEQRAARGTLHGTQAEGDLGYSVSINKNGQRETDGSTYCQSDFIVYDAEFAG